MCGEHDFHWCSRMWSRHMWIDLRFVETESNDQAAQPLGRPSHGWGVKTNGKGDAYLYCRDNPSAEKVSFHSSGRQHVSIPNELVARRGVESRFMNEWEEPAFTSEAIATFTLIFPPWGAVRPLDTPAKKGKSELVIVGHKEKLVVVCFFIVDSSKRMRGRDPHFVLGQLPLGSTKTLHVIVQKEPQNELADRIRRCFPQVIQALPEGRIGGSDYTLWVGGYRGENAAWMSVIPVRYTPPN